MTRIDSATITLDVWDDTLGMRREVTFAVDMLGWIDLPDEWSSMGNSRIINTWWREHSERIRLAAKDGDMGPLTL